MFFKILQLALKNKEPLYLSKLVPFSTLENNILGTYLGNCVSVIEIHGKDYSSVNNEKKLVLFNQVKNAFNSTENVTVTIHTRKVQESNPSINKVSFNLENEISTKWSENFRKVFHHNYYIVISSSTANTLTDNLLGDVVKPSFFENKERVKTAVDRLLNLLNEFNPTVLENEELIRFYYILINGFQRDEDSFQNIKTDVNSYLAHSNIEFFNTYMTYTNGDNVLYSKWLSVTHFENEVDSSDFFQELLSLKTEFSFYQLMQKLTPKQTNDFIKRREKHLENFHDSINDEEFAVVKDAILKNEDTLFNYSFYMQIIGKDLKKVESDLKKAYSIIERKGYNVKIEDENIQLLYHANFCEYEQYAVRKRVKVSRNLASLNSFEKSGDGLYRCSFGHLPTSTFFTKQGDPYHFVFHESEKPQALGNTVVIGGAGSGKTLLISYLMTEALAKYPELIALAFDKQRGMQVITEMLNMEYTDFNDQINLNPLNLSDTPENRDFIRNFFLAMTKKEDMNSEAKIQRAIEDLFNLEKKDRSLKNILSSFGISSDEEGISEIVSTYITGSNSRFFSDKDSLDFKKRLVAFNMDSVFKNKDALSPMKLLISV